MCVFYKYSALISWCFLTVYSTLQIPPLIRTPLSVLVAQKVHGREKREQLVGSERPTLTVCTDGVLQQEVTEYRRESVCY